MTIRSSPDYFWSRVDRRRNGCWIWKGYCMRQGYGIIGVNRKQIKTHRYAWMLQHGEIPKGLCVLHKCDTPPCVNPTHLYLGTQADNMRDCVQRERMKLKLTPAKVRTIRAQVLKGKRGTGAMLARKYRVHPMMISNIKLRKMWKWCI